MIPGPIPDGELALGWERLRTPQLRIELGLPLHQAAGQEEKAGATAVLARLQPEGATLAQAETMLPKSLEVRPLPLALPAGGAGWATRWGCGLDGAHPAWQEVWRRARIARTAYSAECHLDGTLGRQEDGVVGGWPTAAAAAGVFGRLDKARVDGWAVVIPADRSKYASSANRKPNLNPNGEAVPAALDCRGKSTSVLMYPQDTLALDWPVLRDCPCAQSRTRRAAAAAGLRSRESVRFACTYQQAMSARSCAW